MPILEYLRDFVSWVVCDDKYLIMGQKRLQNIMDLIEQVLTNVILADYRDDDRKFTGCINRIHEECLSERPVTEMEVPDNRHAEK